MFYHELEKKLTSKNKKECKDCCHLCEENTDTQKTQTFNKTQFLSVKLLFTIFSVFLIVVKVTVNAKNICVILLVLTHCLLYIVNYILTTEVCNFKFEKKFIYFTILAENVCKKLTCKL